MPLPEREKLMLARGSMQFTKSWGIGCSRSLIVRGKDCSSAVWPAQTSDGSRCSSVEPGAFRLYAERLQYSLAGPKKRSLVAHSDRACRPWDGLPVRYLIELARLLHS